MQNPPVPSSQLAVTDLVSRVAEAISRRECRVVPRRIAFVQELFKTRTAFGGFAFAAGRGYDAALARHGVRAQEGE